MAEKYISLKEATKYCSYSQDYLKLRARQGKLKSIKLGRNWFTTKEWIEEYIRKVSKHSRHPLSPQVLAGERIFRDQRRPAASVKISPFKLGPLIFILVLVGSVIILVLAGVLNFDIFAGHLGWIEEEFVEPVLEKIIPARIIEIKR